MGEIKASASLKDDLGQGLDALKAKSRETTTAMRGDFDDLAQSTSGNFQDMVAAFATGQTAAAAFHEAIQFGVRFVKEAYDSYVDLNRALRDSGQAYDHAIDQQEAINKKIAEGKTEFGAYVSRWGEFVGYLASGVSPGVASALAFGSGATGFSISHGRDEPGTGDYSASGAGSTFAEEQAYRERQQRDAEREAKHKETEARRAAAEALREEEKAIRENNQALRVGIAATLRQYRGRRDFDDRPSDPQDPQGTNASAFEAPGDGSRDGEFGAFSSLPSGYMRALQESQQKALENTRKWGNLWGDSIKASLDAVLFDTNNFGKDFVAIIKKALMQALVGDISASAGGPIGKILGGFLGIKDARTDFEVRTGPELQRASARGKF